MVAPACTLARKRIAGVLPPPLTIKHYRRIFSRFEKLDTRYLGFLHFTAALIWLR